MKDCLVLNLNKIVNSLLSVLIHFEPTKTLRFDQEGFSIYIEIEWQSWNGRENCHDDHIPFNLRRNKKI